MDIRIAHDHRAAVGESPVWCDRTDTIWWVDIRGMSLQRLHPASGAFRRWQLSEPVACIALTESNALVIGLQSGLALFEPESGSVTPIADPEPDFPANRMNDGATSRDGRYYVASVAGPPDRPLAALHRMDKDGTVKMLQDGLHVGNGLAFSPDNRTLYLSDSWMDVARIWQYDHDPATGDISNRRLFHDMRGTGGRPDGACMDAEGGYWIAAIDSATVIRLMPDGRIDRRIALPVTKPTKLAFGGPDLGTLYITSIALPDDDGGRLLALRPGITGLPEPRVPLNLP